MIFAIFLSHLNIQRSSKDLLGPQQKKRVSQAVKKNTFFLANARNARRPQRLFGSNPTSLWTGVFFDTVGVIATSTQWVKKRDLTGWEINKLQAKYLDISYITLIRKKSWGKSKKQPHPYWENHGKSMFTLSRFKQPHSYLGSNLNIPSGKLTSRWLEYLPFSIRNTSSSFRVHFSASELLVLPEYHRHPPQTPKTW